MIITYFFILLVFTYGEYCRDNSVFIMTISHNFGNTLANTE